MKAILLAAGLGTRLSPYTDNWPKCLMPINNKPLLEYWLEILVNAGIKDILINLHYYPEIVKSFIQQTYYSKYVTFSEEENLLGTAGTIANNLNFINESQLILIHADNLCLCDFESFINHHENKRPDFTEITMMTFITSKPKESGIVICDDKGIVNKFFEKSQNYHGDLANAAIYILEYQVVEYLIQNNLNDFSNQVIPKYLGRISTWHNDKILRDIGKPKELLEAQFDLNKINNKNSYENWSFNNKFEKICDKIESINEKKS